MFAGRPPFQGETAISVAVQHLKDAPQSLRKVRPDLPQPVCDLIERMMAKRPEERYPDAATVLEDVRKLIRAAKDSGRLDQVKLTDLGKQAAPETFAGRHPVVALSLLCLLAAGLSAAAGWAMRPKDPLQTQAAKDFGVTTQPTAKEQFLHAMFRAQSEDAFLAVVHHSDSSASAPEWKARAHEQLALMYLRDKDRWKDAREELSSLRAVIGPAGPEFAAKAKAGEVILAAYERDRPRAREIAKTSQDQFEQHGLIPGRDGPLESSGTWQRLLGEAMQLINDRPGEEGGDQ